MVPPKRLYVKVHDSMPEIDGAQLTEIELFHRGISLGKAMIRVLSDGTVEGAYNQVMIETADDEACKSRKQ